MMHDKIVRHSQQQTAEGPTRLLGLPGQIGAGKIGALGLAMMALTACSADGDANATDMTNGNMNTMIPDDIPTDCSVPLAPRSPMRRLTRFEYSNTLRDLLGDTTKPGNDLPSEELGNGFGNDARALSVSTLLVEQYGNVGEAAAMRALTNPQILPQIAPCAATVTPETEAACATEIIAAFTPVAWRRPLEAGEAEGLVALQQAIRVNSPDFITSVGGVIEAILESPEFLYRPEFGVPVEGRPDLMRPNPYEMATRLSYLLWGTMPDATLQQAAAAGELTTDESVLQHATRMLADPRSADVRRFFFDNYLPIASLAQLERDSTMFPKFNSALGAAMRQETQQFLEYEFFQGSGTWSGAMKAPYTFVNEDLATFYGIPNVTGEAFQQVNTDATKRVGFILQAGFLAGTVHSNTSNPVTRGSFLAQKLMCNIIPLPPPEILAQVMPPEPYTGDTARERFTQHAQDAVCAGCHAQMDPMGLALENFDPIGDWRDTENGVMIDASGSVPGVEGVAAGPVELVQKLASTPEVQTCFASHWANYAYGATLDPVADQCTINNLQQMFADSGYNVPQLLLSLTQTDSFLYLPSAKE